MLATICNDQILVGNQRFSSSWLRRECPCPECRHPSSGQYRLEMSTTLDDERPVDCQLEGEQLIVDWRSPKTSHRSRYEMKELTDTLTSPQRLVKSAWAAGEGQKLLLRPFNERLAWLGDLVRDGCALTSLPSINDFDDFVFEFEEPFRIVRGVTFDDVIYDPDSTDIAFTSDLLTAHSDNSFYNGPGIAQFMYCVANEAEGGESTLVDGFRVARDLREADPQAFELLSSVEFEFYQRYESPSLVLVNRTPIIRLDASGEITELVYSQKNMVLRGRATDSDAISAIKKLAAMLADPFYELSFKLEPGQCLMMENSRVLHGRRAFQAAGKRHLHNCYILWDHIVGSYRYQLLSG
jgi:gamma-butyrobetaine dioxygenase